MSPPPSISPTLLRFFRRIVRRYFRRHFHAVCLSLAADPATLSGPLIIIGNHASWWDPMVAFLLAEQLLPNRAHYAPMDAAALNRYRILQKLGIFPIDMNSPRGAAQFLRTGQAILASGGVLWVTPQGRFADPRARPLTFKPGLAALATRTAAQHGSCTILPLAIEYPFWDERLPECLLRLGPPLRVREDCPAPAVHAAAEIALTAEMDTLAHLSMARDPSPFRTILTGTRGAGGFYALGKRFKAAILRQTYTPDHTSEPPAPTDTVSFRPEGSGVEKPASAPAQANGRPTETDLANPCS